MNRKERRALQFGTPEAVADTLAKIAAEKNEALAMRVLRIINGVVYVPIVQPRCTDDVRTWMLPEKDIDPKYYRATTDPKLARYSEFLTHWFYRGIKVPDFVFRPEAMTGIVHRVKRHTLLAYMDFILEDRAPSHGHKMAYLVYVLDMCVEELTWEVA